MVSSSLSWLWLTWPSFPAPHWPPVDSVSVWTCVCRPSVCSIDARLCVYASLYPVWSRLSPEEPFQWFTDSVTVGVVGSTFAITLCAPCVLLLCPSCTTFHAQWLFPGTNVSIPFRLCTVLLSCFLSGCPGAYRIHVNARIYFRCVLSTHEIQKCHPAQQLSWLHFHAVAVVFASLCLKYSDTLS